MLVKACSDARCGCEMDKGYRPPLWQLLVGLVLLTGVIACTATFAPLTVKCTDSARSTADFFMDHAARRIIGKVQTYFATAPYVVNVMTSASKLGSWEQSNPTSIVRWLNYGSSLGADSINIIFDVADIWTAGFVTTTNQAVPNGTVAIVRYNGTHGNQTLIDSTTLAAAADSILFPSKPLFKSRAYYPMIRQAQTWGPAFIGVLSGVPEAILPHGSPILLPNGTSVGAFYVRTRTNVIISYFRTVKVANSGRIMLLDSSSRNFIASNTDADPTTKVINGSTSLTNFTDVKDPLLVATVGALGDSLITCAMPCRLSFGSGSDEVFVTVSSVNDAYNLNKRLVIAVPSDDFLGEIRSATRVSLVATAIAVVVLIVLAIGFVFWLVRPLLKLERRLYASAALREMSDDDDSRSMILEIRNIEEAYDRLNGELKKMKSFLPQSVLHLVPLDTLSKSSEEVPSMHDEGSPGTNTQSQIEQTSTLNNRQLFSVLNFTSILVTRRVTVVVCNVIGFHQLLSALGPMELHRRHCVLTEMILDHAKLHGGTVDTMLGDHFYVSWNAGVPRKGHTSVAAKFALAMEQRMMEASLLMDGKSVSLVKADGDESALSRLTFGIATGSALCGNFGCEGLKHPTIVGPVVHQAFALVHQCKTESLAILCNNEAAAILEDEMFVVHWDYVILPCTADATIISCIFGLRTPDGWERKTAKKPRTSSNNSTSTNNGKPSHHNRQTLEEARKLVNAAFNLLVKDDVEGAERCRRAVADNHKFLLKGLGKFLF